MKRISILSVLLACMMILSASASFADGAAVSEVSGQTVIPVQENNIRMVNETVWMKDEKVTATFTFENVTDRRVEIKMGFPFRKGEDPLDPITFDMQKEPKFIVRVNKSNVPVTKMTVDDSYKKKPEKSTISCTPGLLFFNPRKRRPSNVLTMFSGGMTVIFL